MIQVDIDMVYRTETTRIANNKWRKSFEFSKS